MRRLAPVLLLIAACSEDVRERDSGARDASSYDATTTTDGGPTDARFAAYDGSCEPSRDACQAEVDACTLNADFATTTDCLIRFSECYVDTLEATIPCFDRFGCVRALEGIDCATGCEAQNQACLRLAQTPGDRERCREGSDACHNEECGVAPWRHPSGGEPPC